MWAGHKRGHCHIFLSQFFKLCLPLATASKRGGQTVHPVKPGPSRRPVTKTLGSTEGNPGGFAISIEVKMSEDINSREGCFFFFTDIGNNRGLWKSSSKTGANPRPVTTKRLPTHDKLSTQEGRFYYFGWISVSMNQCFSAASLNSTAVCCACACVPVCSGEVAVLRQHLFCWNYWN